MVIPEHAIVSLRAHVAEAFKAGTPTFPHFTLHGAEHLEELDRLARLIGKAIPALDANPERLNLLRVALILHDFAMVDVPDPAREEELRREMGTDLPFADLVRKTHQDEIERSFTRGDRISLLTGLFPDPNPHFIEDVVTIARHHRFHPLAQAPEALRDLCALMRILDELDIGSRRAPLASYLALRGRMEPIERFHWLKHLCTKSVESYSTFVLEERNHRRILKVFVAVKATERTWKGLQEEIVRKLHGCLDQEGINSILRETLQVEFEIAPSPERDSGPTLYLNPIVREDLEALPDDLLASKKAAKGNPGPEVPYLPPVPASPSPTVSLTPATRLLPDFKIIAIPPESLDAVLCTSGRLTVIRNRYVRPEEESIGGIQGAPSRIYAGPADSGKTRAAFEWVKDLTENAQSQWVILRTDMGTIPENLDRIILDTSFYEERHQQMPQKAILFLDDLPVNLPPPESALSATDAVRTLFRWFQELPYFRERRLVGTLRSEDMHARPEWPDVLPTLGQELELIRLRPLNPDEYRQLWEGMATGSVSRSSTEGLRDFHFDLEEEFLQIVTERPADPEAVAVFVQQNALKEKPVFGEADAELFSESAVETWLRETWPALRDAYGLGARVFFTLARFLEAGRRPNSGFPSATAPLWQYHKVYGPSICREKGGISESYIPVLDHLLRDGHAVGESGQWIRPKLDFLLQADKLEGVDIELPTMTWFVQQGEQLTSFAKRLLAVHLAMSASAPSEHPSDNEDWLTGWALGLGVLARLETDLHKRATFFNRAASVLDRLTNKNPANVEAWENLGALVSNEADREKIPERKATLRQREISIYEEIVNRFGDSAEPALREQVATALVNKGGALGQAGRPDEAVAAYDEVERRFSDAPETALREQVAKALVNKGVALGQAGRMDEAVAAYNEVEQRFADSAEPTLREGVARALVNKGVALGKAGRTDEAVAAYDEVERRFGDAPDTALREQVAKALVNKGITLGQAGRTDEEMAAYEEVKRRFSDAPEPAVQEEVATALVNKGLALGQAGRTDEAVAAYDEVEQRFGDAPETALREQVAMALVNKGVALGQAGRTDEEVAAYDEVEQRFADSAEPTLREGVARALVNKGVALGKAGRTDEEVAAYDEVERRFGDAPETALRERVAKALVNKGITLGQAGRPDEEVAAYEEVERRFGNAAEPPLRELVAEANNNLVFELLTQGRFEEALVAAKRAVALGSGRYNLACALARLNELDEAFSELEYCLTKGEISREHVLEDPDWEHLRDHPKFQELTKEPAG